MAEANTKIAVAFPPDNVAPAKKLEKQWGLQTAKAIWYHNSAYGPGLFYNRRDDYRDFIEFAMNKQSDDLVKPSVGVNPQSQEHSFIGGIDWTPKGYAVKRINSTVTKIFNKQYDPVATSIDPIGINRKEAYKASVKAWMDHGAWIQERQQMVGMDVMPEGMSMDDLPMNDEALQIYMNEDFKLIDEINLEIGIKHQLNRNNFDILKEKLDRYIAILPVVGVWVGLDSEDMPVVKILDPRKTLAPYSDQMDFKRIAYGAYVDEYSIAEFRKLVGGEIPKDELDRLIESFSKKGEYTTREYSASYPETDRDVDKIQVLHFEVAQSDEYTYLQRQDKFGNERFVTKPYDYYRGKDESFHKKYGESRKIHRVPKSTTYGGYWVVGSETVFGYGEKNYCKGELGFKFRASNMVDGITTCLAEQIIPSITAIERLDKKIQMCIAGALPATIIGLDLAAMRKVQFKMGDGTVASDADLMNLLFQKGVVLSDSSEYGPGSTRKMFEIGAGGISSDLGKYVELMIHELNQLDEIIGYNKVTTASTLSPETGARVAQQMETQTDTALDHLYRADRGICKEVYSAFGHLHRISVQRNPQKYAPILGEEAVARIITSAPHDEYGIDVEARPTQAEWNVLYQELQVDPRITPEDRAAVRRCNSLKQAYAYLKVLTRKREKAQQQFELQKIQETTNQAQQSAQITIQGDMAKLAFERETMLMEKQIDREKEYDKHKYKMEELSLQGTLQIQGKIAETTIESETSLKIAKTKPKTQ